MPETETLYRTGADRLEALNAKDTELSRIAFNLVNLGFAIAGAGVFAVLRSPLDWNPWMWVEAVGSVLTLTVVLVTGVVAAVWHDWVSPPSLETIKDLDRSNDGPALTEHWLTMYYSRTIDEGEQSLRDKRRLLLFMAFSLFLEAAFTFGIIGQAIVAAVGTSA